jgi:predicted nucleotide-binding protein (sugar kinase/HSP70/actin superfamily)
MKKTYKVLIPMMLPVHFTMIRNSLRLDGFDVDLLTTNHREIVDEGLKNVHNDTCYPALLVIGQFIDALKSGKYDLDKTALMITQTGGGCRASNYIHLLRKALKRSGYGHIPVISLNISGLESNPGFKFGFNLLRRMIFSLLYGDIIMLLANQCRPYEVENGTTDRLVETWIDRLTEDYKHPKNLKHKHVTQNLEHIAADFAAVELRDEQKVKVGVVGEIFIKYAALGNNNLEDFLASEGVETVVPGLLDFIIFKADNRVEDVKIYGGNPLKKAVFSYVVRLCERRQQEIIDIVGRYPKFRPPVQYEHIKELVRGYLGYGNKMGEGWLLTGEMIELVSSGVSNVVCTQPFGCLPNHIVGKGMIRKIKENYAQANIVAIDYDPGATRINQENRIKLMLANARITTGNQGRTVRGEVPAHEKERVTAGA